MRKIHFLILLLLPTITTAGDGAQNSRYIHHVESFGFFDNREVQSPHQFSGTYFGTRLSADWGLQLAGSSIAAGGYVVKDFGQRGISASDWTLYYRYEGTRFSGAFGSFPRRLLFRELPDVFVDEALRYYTPNLGGALIQYHSPRASIELYCDWLSRQSPSEREIFEIASDGEWLASSTFHLGYNARLTHFSVRKGITPDKVYDKLMLNPHLTCSSHASSWGYYTLTVGLMASLNRDRTDKVWKSPYGMLCDATLGIPFARSSAAIELRYRGYHGNPLMSDYERYGALLTASFHFTEGVVDNSQQIHVRLHF